MSVVFTKFRKRFTLKMNSENKMKNEKKKRRMKNAKWTLPTEEYTVTIMNLYIGPYLAFSLFTYRYGVHNIYFEIWCRQNVVYIQHINITNFHTDLMLLRIWSRSFCFSSNTNPITMDVECWICILLLVSVQLIFLLLLFLLLLLFHLEHDIWMELAFIRLRRSNRNEFFIFAGYEGKLNCMFRWRCYRAGLRFY